MLLRISRFAAAAFPGPVLAAQSTPEAGKGKGKEAYLQSGLANLALVLLVPEEEEQKGSILTSARLSVLLLTSQQIQAFETIEEEPYRLSFGDLQVLFAQ